MSTNPFNAAFTGKASAALDSNPFDAVFAKASKGYDAIAKENPFTSVLLPKMPPKAPPPALGAAYSAGGGDPLVSTLQQAGFQGEALKTAWAIAKRESGGRASAFNPRRETGDLSYGLFQINMLDKLGPDRRARYGLKSNEDLLDPATNARVAYAMSKGGTDFGPWGIGPHAYRKMPALDYSGFPGAQTLPYRPGYGGPGASTLPYRPGSQPAYQNQTLPFKAPRDWSFASAASWTGGRGSNLGGPGMGTHGSNAPSVNWESQNAWDVGVPIGTPIYAQEDGTVAGNIGVQASRPADGMRVQINGADSYWLGHLSRLAVQAGQRVRRGQLIGYSGASQNGAAHLHIARQRGWGGG
jgi:murein DD-endopeptidase MepM/ murein hydrolase activator NlpD